MMANKNKGRVKTKEAVEVFFDKVQCKTCLSHKDKDKIITRRSTGKPICLSCLEAIRQRNREKLLCQIN